MKEPRIKVKTRRKRSQSCKDKCRWMPCHSKLRPHWRTRTCKTSEPSSKRRRWWPRSSLLGAKIRRVSLRRLLSKFIQAEIVTSALTPYQMLRRSSWTAITSPVSTALAPSTSQLRSFCMIRDVNWRPQTRLQSQAAPVSIRPLLCKIRESLPLKRRARTIKIKVRCPLRDPTLSAVLPGRTMPSSPKTKKETSKSSQESWKSFKSSRHFATWAWTESKEEGESWSQMFRRIGSVSFGESWACRMAQGRTPESQLCVVRAPPLNGELRPFQNGSIKPPLFANGHCSISVPHFSLHIWSFQSCSW